MSLLIRKGFIFSTIGNEAVFCPPIFNEVEVILMLVFIEFTAISNAIFGVFTAVFHGSFFLSSQLFLILF